MDGVFNIYKEKGYTSHDVVAVVRKTLKMKRVGHTGTLDPEAEGVLPVCVGKATKLADYIMADKKGYRAEITFGITTTTQDHTGDILEEKEVKLTKEEIVLASNKFIGNIKQLPPMYSAIKIDGKKLYELARQGVEVKRKERDITIYDIKVLEFNAPNKAIIDVICQKGTYIRTLCYDIGLLIGCGAHMSSLSRTFSGIFQIEKSIKLDRLKELSARGEAESAMLLMDDVLNAYQKIVVNERADKLLKNGGFIYEYDWAVKPPDVTDSLVRAYDYSGNLIGLFKLGFDVEKGKAFIKPSVMLM